MNCERRDRRNDRKNRFALEIERNLDNNRGEWLVCFVEYSSLRVLAVIYLYVRGVHSPLVAEEVGIDTA